MNSCETCGYWKREFNEYTCDWDNYFCSYVIDHYQLTPTSKGVDVLNTAGNDLGDCEYWEPV